MADRVDIYLQRNEDWGRSFTLTADGAPIDITGCTIAMQVREKLLQNLVANADVDIVDPANGVFSIFLKGSDNSPLSQYGAAIQTANLNYDCRLTDRDGFNTVLFGGVLILSRGETIQ